MQTSLEAIFRKPLQTSLLPQLQMKLVVLLLIGWGAFHVCDQSWSWGFQLVAETHWPGDVTVWIFLSLDWLSHQGLLVCLPYKHAAHRGRSHLAYLEGSILSFAMRCIVCMERWPKRLCSRNNSASVLSVGSSSSSTSMVTGCSLFSEVIVIWCSPECRDVGSLYVQLNCFTELW